MATIGSIWINVGARTKGLNRALASAGKRLQRFRNEMVGHVQTAALWATGAATAAALAFRSMMDSAIKAGSRIQEMAARTGLAEEFLSRVAFAAEQSGASIEDFERAVRQMQLGATGAFRGLKIAQSNFDALGVSITDSEGKLKDSETLFLDVASAINGLSDASERTFIAQKIFGKSGTQLLPMLDSLDKIRKKSEDVAFIWSKKTANAADHIGDSISALKTKWDALITGAMVKLFPMMERLVEAASNLMNAIDFDLIVEKIDAFVTDRRIELWLARIKAGWLGVKLVAITVWEGVHIVAAAALKGIAIGIEWIIDKLVVAARFWTNMIPDDTGVAWIDAVKDGMRGATDEMSRWQATADAFGDRMDRVMRDSAGNIIAASNAYMDQARIVAGLASQVDKQRKVVTQLSDAEQDRANRLYMAGGKKKEAANAGGEAREIRRALISIPGLQLLAKKKEEVSDPETHRLLDGIRDELGGLAAVGG